MYRFARPLFLAALLVGGATQAFAADLYEPPIVEAPPPVTYEQEVVEDYGGWYIRGDLDYHYSTFKGADYITYGVTCCGLPVPGTGSFDFGELKGAFSVGAGVGYQLNKYLRADLTVDYLFGSEFTGQTSGVCGGLPCTSSDGSSYSAFLTLANAYVDLGTWHGFTPYVGAGIGGAYVKWDDLNNTIAGVTTVHAGAKNMRFAYALMAGTSYCVTDRIKLDVGYRYSRVSGGRMFELAPVTGPGAGPGFDEGLNIHEGRAGLRYQFGGKSECYDPEPMPYEPAPEPIYTK